MKNKNILIFLLILLLLPSAIAADFTLDRLPIVYAFLKGTRASFEFEDKIYNLRLGDLDFDNKRVTMQWISPQRLGTNILRLNKVIEIDLDGDNNDNTKKDVKIILIDILEDGLNEDGVEGTAKITFEPFLDNSVVETNITTTTTTTTTIKDNSTISAGEEITGNQILDNSLVVTYKNWIIIAGVAVLFIVLIVLTKKKLIAILKNVLKKKKVEVSKEPKGPKEHIPCPKCGRDTVVGDKFCIGCGTKLSSKPQFCTKCGERVRRDSEFCSICGFKI